LLDAASCGESDPKEIEEEGIRTPESVGSEVLTPAARLGFPLDAKGLKIETAGIGFRSRWLPVPRCWRKRTSSPGAVLGLIG